MTKVPRPPLNIRPRQRHSVVLFSICFNIIQTKCTNSHGEVVFVGTLLVLLSRPKLQRAVEIVHLIENCFVETCFKTKMYKLYTNFPDGTVQMRKSQP